LIIADSISGDLGVGNDDITNILRLLIFPTLLEISTRFKPAKKVLEPLHVSRVPFIAVFDFQIVRALMHLKIIQK